MRRDWTIILALGLGATINQYFIILEFYQVHKEIKELSIKWEHLK